MPFVNLAHYCYSAGGSRNVYSQEMLIRGEVTRKTESDKGLAKGECRIAHTKEMVNPNTRILLDDFCFCTGTCGHLHLLKGDEFIPRPQILNSRIIIVPCGVEDAEFDLCSENIMVMGKKFRMCVCGNRRIIDADISGLNYANIYTICQNNLNTVIYNEEPYECIHCCEPVMNIEPANGFGGNGYYIENNRCLNCMTGKEILRILDADGFKPDWIVAPREPFQVNNCTVAQMISCASTWEKDLTQDGDVEENPGPIQAFAEMFLKCHGRMLEIDDIDRDATLYKLVLKYWPGDVSGPSHNCAIFKHHGRYFMAFMFRGKWFASKESRHSVVPTSAKLCFSSYIRDLTRENIESNPGPDPISFLNQHAQKNQKSFPAYEFEKVIQDGEFMFKATCHYLEYKTTSIPAFSKKGAKMNAAEMMIELVH